MRFYKIEMVGHGGEAVCGSVSEDAYDYWSECEEDLDDYVDEEIPQIDRYWHDIDDIAHLNGCDNGTVRIVEAHAFRRLSCARRTHDFPNSL